MGRFRRSFLVELSLVGDDMIDPKCPHCQTPASEHLGGHYLKGLAQPGACLHHWLAEIALGRSPFDSSGVPNMLDWQHAGPLLVEMMETGHIRKIRFSYEHRVPKYQIHFFSGCTVESVYFTLAICRAYLIWKANQG